MTELDIAALRRIAESARQGDWENTWGISWERRIVIRDEGCLADVDSDENAEHIAAFDPPTVLALIDLAENPRDEYHTMDELYRYRMLYNALLANQLADAGGNVHKSWRHATGEECFGGGWFIITIQLPTGQVSNHYKAEHWDLFRVPEREHAEQWDGHTPQVAADRMERAARGDA